jgi:hypothetical protein
MSTRKLNMRNRLIAATASAALATAAVVTGSVIGASSASAAPTSCDLFDTAIYNAPAAASLPAPGNLIACNSTALPNVPGNVPMKAWKVQYSSTDASGAKVAVSGTIAVPTAAWTGSGTRPVVAFNPGTLGIGSQCAFSKQLSGQFQDEYEGTNIQKALQAGIAVAATDGIGYLNGQVHPYVIGADSGHALLDIARAAGQVPGSGLSATTRTAIWGYSEGGQASLWAAQLAKTYAPSLNIVGAAAGGVPGDLTVVGNQLNGSPFAGFLADAAIGLSTAYPSLPFTSLLNSTGKSAVAAAKTTCLLGTLANFVGAKLESFTTNGYSLAQLRNIAGPDGTTWGQVLDAQTLGVNIGKPGSGAKYTIGFPTMQYRGAAEEIIDTKSENATRDAYCKAGITTDWDQGYPGEHLIADGQAVDNVVSWLTDRFNGKTAPDNCAIPSL